MNTQVADHLLGSLVDGRYRIRGRVAQGGMATVYSAVDERLERAVALKMIHAVGTVGADGRQMSLERFTDEAKTIARLTHPNVVAVYDQGSHAGLPYLVMEYVRGRTLRDLLAERRRLSPAEALAIMEQILSALGAAHRAGLVHRDVKPENVLVAEPPNGAGDLLDAVVKVADFGLARAVEASAQDAEGASLMATAAYVSPELVADGYADARSDVYSAGIVLFEMLTGRVPYDGSRPVEVAWQHVDRDVPAPSQIVAGLPSVLDDLVVKATRRSADARPTDAGAMLAAVVTAREALASAATTRMPAVDAPTMVVSQVPADQRPSWARLPHQQPVRGHRRHSEAAAAGRLDRLKAWYQGVNADPRGRMALTAGLVVVSLLVVGGGWWFGFGRYETTPQLLNRTRAQAEQIADRAGLVLRFDDGQFREDVAKDVVLAQDPPPGERVVRGGVVMLTLSLGPERYLVPNVVGKTLESAVADLQAEPLALVPKKVAERYDDTVPKGTVISTKPAAGAQVKPGTTVEIVLSKGKAPLSVPFVENMPLEQARATLEGMGLRVLVEYVQSDKPRDTVVKQTPASGTGAEPNAEVKLQVSQGPPAFGMPSVLGMGCGDGKRHLEGVGLVVTVDSPVGEFGWVRDQNPGPNQPVSAGQNVVIRCGL